jgi:hypothetical protein
VCPEGASQCVEICYRNYCKFNNFVKWNSTKSKLKKIVKLGLAFGIGGKPLMSGIS